MTVDDNRWWLDSRFWSFMRPVLFNEKRMLGTDEEVEGILSLLGVSPGAHILDMCCGPGRHCLGLARRGFQVTGVDLTEDYLEEARSRAGTEGLAIEFVKDDMRRFRRPAAFDAAVNYFTSFGFFDSREDDFRVMENLASSLKPGGQLLMEMAGREPLARDYLEKSWDEVDGAFYLRESTVEDGWGRIHNRFVRIEGNQSEEAAFDVYVYSGPELLDMAGRCGLVDARLYGTIHGHPYDQHAERLILTATKG